jgi:hypothetical protein
MVRFLVVLLRWEDQLGASQDHALQVKLVSYLGAMEAQLAA